MANVILDNNPNGQTLSLVEKSARPRSVQQAPPYISRAPFYIQNPTLFTMDQWRLIAKEPVTRLCIRHVIREISALELEITSDTPDQDEGTIVYFKQLLDDADDGDGWNAFLSRCLQDAMELPIGAVIEIAPDDLTGMAGGLYHVDGATVYPTYDRNIPYVQINPYDTAQRVYFRRGQVERLLLMPRVDLRRRPFQEAPVESCFMSIEALSRMYIYYMKQLGDTPMAGILDLMDMTETEANDWALNFREMYEGIDPLKIPILYDHVKPAKFIPMARNPQDMNLLENFRRFAELVASAFGLSIGDLRLFEHDRVLAGVEASQRVTARSGIGFYAQVIENFLNKNILMSVRSGIRAKFKLGMTGESQAEAQLALSRAQLLMTLGGNQPVMKQQDMQKQAQQWKLIDVPLTGLPPAQTPGGGAGGMGAMLGAGDNMDSINQDTQDVGQMQDQNSNVDQLAGQSLSDLGADQGGGQPYDQSQYKSLVNKATDAGEKEGHPFRGNQYRKGEEDDDDATPGKTFGVLPGTLPKGTKVTLANGLLGQALGLARKTQKEAQSRVDWWAEALGMKGHAHPANNLWQVVMEGTLPPQSVISAAKKAKNIKEGAEVKLANGLVGVYSGAKRFNEADAQKQADFMTQDSGYQHVVHKAGGVYLIVKLGGIAAIKQGAHNMADYDWPAGSNLYGTKLAVGLKTVPHPGDKVFYEGVVYQVTAKDTGTGKSAKAVTKKENAEKEAKNNAKAEPGSKYGVFPVATTNKGTMWVAAKILATGTLAAHVTPPAPETTEVPPSLADLAAQGKKPIDINDIGSGTSLIAGDLVIYPSGSKNVYELAESATMPGKVYLYAKLGNAQQQADFVGGNLHVLQMPNKHNYFTLGKLITAMSLPPASAAAAEPAVTPKPPQTVSTALTEKPKIGDKVTMTDGAVLEAVEFTSGGSDVVNGKKMHYWTEATAIKKANELTSSSGVQHLPFVAPAPPNNQNTKTAYYVGKVALAGTNTPATPTLLPVPGEESPFPSSVGSVGATKASKGSAYVSMEDKPVVIPPPEDKFLTDRPTVQAWPNNLSDFPVSLDDLQHVSGLGGTTGAELYMSAQGTRFVVKKGASAGHVRAEALANDVYRAAGVPVPDGRIYEGPDGPTQVTRYVEGTLLDDLSGSARDAANRQLGKAYAVDALLANWDVVGLESDNVIVDKNGTAWRIDNGSSFDYRAQGSQDGKIGWWGGNPLDLWSMRTSQPAASATFAHLGWKDVSNGLQDVSSKRNDILEALGNSSYKAAVEERLDMFKHMAELSQPMLQSGFDESYVEGVAHADLNLKISGIVDALPGVLKPPGAANGHGNYETNGWKDEKGKVWDDLRGDGTKNNIMAKFVDFVNDPKNGGSSTFLEGWFNGQAASSWTGVAGIMQYMMWQKSGKPQSEFYWKHGFDSAKKNYEDNIKKYGSAKMEASAAMYHAFVYNILSRVSFPNNDPVTHTVRVYRTEASHVLSDYGIKANQSQLDGITYPHAPISSTSIASPAYLNHKVTCQHVPWHDIIGVYFHSRNGNDNTCAFYQDGENEFLAMLHNNKASYIPGHV